MGAAGKGERTLTHRIAARGKRAKCPRHCPFPGHRVPMRPRRPAARHAARRTLAATGAAHQFRGRCRCDFDGLCPSPRGWPVRPERAGPVSAAGADFRRVLLPADPAAAAEAEAASLDARRGAARRPGRHRRRYHRHRVQGRSTTTRSRSRSRRGCGFGWCAARVTTSSPSRPRPRPRKSARKEADKA